MRNSLSAIASRILPGRVVWLQVHVCRDLGAFQGGGWEGRAQGGPGGEGSREGSRDGGWEGSRDGGWEGSSGPGVQGGGRDPENDCSRVEVRRR